MQHYDRAARYDTVGSALFFIWIGVAWLADLGWGVGLLGVAVIMFGGQAARAYSGVMVERFWLVVGALFALGGV